MEDIGLRAVDGLFEQLRVDDEWSTREDRMFSWLAHRLQQTVRASPPFTEGSLVLVRLEAHTVVVDKVTADKKFGQPTSRGVESPFARERLFLRSGRSTDNGVHRSVDT